MSAITRFLAAQKKLYLTSCREKGGKAGGFRKFMADQYASDSRPFLKLALEMLMDATTKAWECPPRRRGPDLFSINDYIIP